MTLEDFFTLTEMKDGLTALSRVEDLVTVMQKEKDCSTKNVSDASRQWIAVASTIVATENKDCLDLFIKLEGVSYIDKWLNDAQKLCTDSDESFLEESIITLLQALDKLYVNNEDSFTLEVWNTLKNLFGHKSTVVQDRARVVFNRCWKEWKRGSEVEGAVVLSEDLSSKLVSDETMPSASAIPPTGEALPEESHTAEPSVRVIPPNVSSDILTEMVDHVKNNAQTNPPLKDSLAFSVVSKSGQDDSCPKDSSTSSLREVSILSNSEAPQTQAVEEESDLPKTGEFSKLEEREDKVEVPVSSPTEPKPTRSDLEVVSSQDHMKQLTLQNNSKVNQKDVLRQSNSETDCPMECSSDSKGVEREPSQVSNCNTVEDGECSPEAEREPSVDVNMETEPDDSKKAPMTNLGSDEDKDEDGSDEDRDFRNAYEFSKPVMDTKRSDATDKRRSDVELDYGVDALEVARQVAKAVEREVDPTRCSSSSSAKSSEDGPKQPDSPDSTNEPSQVLTKVDTSVKIHTSEEECGRNNPDSSKVAESVEKEREKETKTEKGFAGFDLNEEVCSDEMDQPLNPVATTISVVSASRPATAHGFPVAPLQFEGTLGWKGSAATSAFRPAAAVASSRRNSDSDTKNPSSVGGMSDSSSTKQRQDWLDFDLNVAEGAPGDESGKRIPASVEDSPKRSENFKLLDLNLVEDGGDDLPSNPTAVHMYNRNGHHPHHHHSPSPALSSSSVQPSLRNFDLNLMEPLEQGLGNRPIQTVNAFPVPKSSDSSVISIMGTRVEINKRETVPQILSLSNGKAIEPDVDTSSTMMGTGSFLGLAPSGSYAHPPVFGYNGLTAPPQMSLPTAAMYGPGNSIPYFLDSRSAATAIPQIVHSASPVPPYSQPLFMMSMGQVAQPSLNGAGPSRAVNFDLNSGLVLDGGGIREMGPRQFFVPGPVRPSEENLRPNFQANPSSSGLGGKRKEPDGGWEPFQVSYKQQQPPWR